MAGRKVRSVGRREKRTDIGESGRRVSLTELDQPPDEREGLRHIDLLMLRPSVDLGRLANEYEPELPRAFRFLTRGFGTKETRYNDLLSLVMFQSDYVGRLIELGEADASARLSDIRAFLTPAD